MTLIGKTITTLEFRDTTPIFKTGIVLDKVQGIAIHCQRDIYVTDFYIIQTSEGIEKVECTKLSQVKTPNP